jgi:hypothetical protein
VAGEDKAVTNDVDEQVEDPQEERIFTIGEAAAFFDQTTTWLRWREGQGLFDRSDGTVPGSRLHQNKQGGGDRVYELADIEEMADGLLRWGALDSANHRRVMKRIRASEAADKAFEAKIETRRVPKLPHREDVPA